jgi:acyl transferase domain-containing protein/acyl carrier protein
MMTDTPRAAASAAASGSAAVGATANGDAIAIVGIGCRFPGGIVDVRTFWRLLQQGGDAITEVPASRYDLGRFFDERPATPGRTMSRYGGFVEPIESFDAAFFDISPREAQTLDPHQRLLLEVAWEALEDAGADTTRLRGSRTGVYVGQWVSDFESRLFADPDRIDFLMTTGSGRYAASGRLSYALGLRGPSVSVDTACSSSLVTVHLAARALRNRECMLALAGGVNVILQPHITIAYSQSRMMAADGRCKFGDASGDGYVRSEGAGIVVLKRLDEALADGDRIYAVIRGSAVNNDGTSSGVLGRPSRIGHEEVLRAAYADAGIAPARVGYVEAHGTGTRAGDPVEIDALATVLGEGRQPGARCAMGSVKTNIGHTESAAGVAGLIKATLALHHAAIPPSLHFKEPNPRVPWADLPLEIVQSLRPWPDVGGARVAGVNSFGISGTNAHMVLESAPALAAALAGAPPSPTARPRLLALSARSPQALSALALRHAEHLAALPAARWPDALWSAATRRGALEHRIAFVGAAGEGDTVLVEALRRHAEGDVAAGAGTFTGTAFAESPARVVFVCPGQGGQWLGMARELLQREPAFRAALERCDAAAQPYLGESLLALLEQAPEATMQRIDRVQPLLVALAIAWGETLRAAGIEAHAVVGHSMGEVAAAHLAGAIDLPQAMRIICRRSALMQRESGRGAMALVDLPAARMNERLRAMPETAAKVTVAVVNSPRSCVVSGDTAAVQALLQALQQEQVFCRPIQVDVASHSPQMDGPAQALAAELADLQPAPSRIPWYSTVRAAPLDGTQATASYWASNLRQTVRFGDTVARLAADGLTVFVELGPHPVLKPSIEQTLESVASVDPLGPQAGPARAALCTGHRDEGDDLAWHRLLARLWTLGVQPDWQRVLPLGRYVPLPAYPWQRERHWGEASQRQAGSVLSASSAGVAGGRRHPLLQRRFDAAAQGGKSTCLWETTLDASATGAHRIYLDHRVREAAVLPAAAMVEAVLAAARESRPDTFWALVDVHFIRALPVDAESRTRMQLRIDWSGSGGGRFELQTLARGGAEGTVHCHGELRPDLAAQDEPPAATAAATTAAATAEEMDAEAAYDLLAGSGLPYGPAFRCLRRLRLGGGGAGAMTAQAELFADPAQADPHAADHHAYPPLFDATLQALLAEELLASEEQTALRVPVAIGRLSARRPLRPAATLQAGVARDGGRIVVSDAKGQPLLRAEGVRFAAVGETRPALASLLQQVAWAPVIEAPSGPKVAPVPGPLLVLGAGGGLADALAAVVDRATPLRRLADAAPAASALREACDALQAMAPGARVQVLDLRALDLPPSSDAPDLASLDAAWSGAIDGVRTLALALAGTAPAPALWLATRGAVAAGSPAPLAFEHGALWGIGRVLAHEHPQLDVRLLDLTGGAATASAPVPTEAASLAALLAAPPAPRQLALRVGHWHAPRLAPLPVPALTGEADELANWRAALGEPGTPQSLHWRQATRPAPEAGWVEIEVEAAGLNFLDLLSALGAYPGVEGGTRPLGLECAGRVARVGPGVSEFAAGDAVVAVCNPALGRHAVARASLVQRRPAGLSSLEAAGLPIAFATVWHSLADLARLEPGEMVLVHSAAGGVGLAALQVVRHLGGQVIATAGTPEKRAWLKAQGIEHVFDSRSTAFADDVLAATSGRGVDVVLNALAGEAIEAGLRCLATGGRFIEMGKRDIYGGTAVSLAPFRKSLGYFHVDLDAMMRERPQRLGRILRDVMQRFEAGHFVPLPVQRYDAARLADAFRDLMPGTHTGKHVVDLGEPPPAVALAEGGHAPVRANGAYLVTGGLGALGLRLAHWLAERGAGRIVLTGRREPDAAALERITAMRALGAEVQAERCDIADGAQVAALLERLRAGGRPLRGVLHAAGVLDDALVTAIDPARARAVRDPKVLGAWHLDRVTAADPLDFFVMLSSVASLLGTPGQGAYAAANAVMDALAHDRHARGLPALAVNLGPVCGEGLAAQQRVRGDSLARLGLDGLDAAQVVAGIDRLVATGAPQAACMRLDAARWHAAMRREGAVDLVEPVATARTAGPSAEAQKPLAEQLAAAPAGQPRRALMESMLREEVGQVLRIAPARVPADRPLRALGLDSLMALELRSRLERRTGLTLSPTLAWNHPTVQLLGAHLEERLGVALDAGPAAPAAATSGAPAADGAPAAADAPSADNVDDLLAQLQSLGTDEVARLLDTAEGSSR